MLKRAFALVLLLAVSACLAVPAWADVLWEPMHDDYYNENRAYTEYVGRRYYTNGVEGCVIVYKEPAGKEQVDVLPNGCKMYVSFETKNEKDGVKWGIIQYEYKDGAYIENSDWDTSEKIIRSGWVPMDSMWLIYDYQSFAEEYGDEFEEFTGDAEDYIDGDKVIFCWNYPGTERQCDYFRPFGYNEEMNLEFAGVWEDEEGRLWGNIEYYYDVRSCWVCLSDPENDSIPPVQRGEPVNLTPTDTAKVERGVSGRNNNNIYLALAFSLVIISIGGIVYIPLKKKSEKNEK